MAGTLYVVATPIGNLQDLTLRAADVLRSVDHVVAENRSRALALLSHLGVSKPITVINSYQEERRAGRIIEMLQSGKSLALITGAGTPCISDPGSRVVREAGNAGIDVRLVPGASAAVGAFSVAGLPYDKFLFYGFLPQKRGKRRKVLEELSLLPYPVVFFESPRRLAETLRLIVEACGDREVVVLKELTKVHEETWRDRASVLADRLSAGPLRGEYTLILGCREK